MRVGINQRVITPELGVDLAGFGRPDRKAREVHDDLYLSTMVLEQNGEKFLFICADIIGFGFTAGIKKEIWERFRIAEDRVLLAASHTHSGPQTAGNMLGVTGEADSGYIQFLNGAIMNSVQAALDSVTEMEIYYGKAQCNIGINRRLIVGGKAEFAPNEEGPLDREIIALKFVKDGSVAAVLYNYACHPSTINTDYISADYVGRAREVIQESYGSKIPVFFIQGCSGNIRVRSIEGNGFRAGTWEDVNNFGTQVGSSVASLCRSEMEKLDMEISSELVTLMLPFEKLPDKNELEDMKLKGSAHEKVWAQKMLDAYESIKREAPFTIQRISLSKDFSIIAMSGEVCVEYGLHIKRKNPGKTVIPAAYSNGVIGYIPTAEMFEQGGYEPDRSTIYFSLPSRFDRSIEEKILVELDRINI